MNTHMSEVYKMDKADGNAVTAEMIIDALRADVEKAEKFAKSTEAGVTLISEDSVEKPKSFDADFERDPDTLGRPVNPEDV